MLSSGGPINAAPRRGIHGQKKATVAREYNASRPRNSRGRLRNGKPEVMERGRPTPSTVLSTGTLAGIKDRPFSRTHLAI
jgi:hypothetical protein